MKPKIHPNGHVLYTSGDCQPLHKEGVLHCPVCDHGLAICKLCGAAEIELDKPCPYAPDLEEISQPT